jgi:hypothetical protein
MKDAPVVLRRDLSDKFLKHEQCKWRLKSAGAFSSNSKMISMQALFITVSTPEASRL